MDWEEVIRSAIAYIEQRLLLLRSPDDVAHHVHLSSIYLQQAFHIMTGCTVGEYIRCRKLHEAAQELIHTRQKVIDIAFKYGYETPESFTKAFSRFHGFPPSQVRKWPGLARPFLPIYIHIDIRGGAADLPPAPLLPPSNAVPFPAIQKTTVISHGGPGNQD